MKRTLKLIAFFLFVLTVSAAPNCGTPKPPPVVPPGEHSCLEACSHVQDMSCPTGMELCLRLCQNVAGNNPHFPTCIANAPSCAAVDACQ